MTNLCGQRRTEKHRLAFFHRPEQAEHFLDVRIEAHIEEAVRFIHDEDVELTKIDLFHLLIIQDAPGCRHIDVKALLDPFILLGIADATEKTADSKVLHAAGQFIDIRLDLHRQLPGRSDDEGFDLSVVGLGGNKALENRNGVDGCLSAAGFRLNHHVLSGKCYRKHPLLDIGALFKAGPFNTGEDLLMEG